MSNGAAITVVAGDAGGANALWPVLRPLRLAGAEPLLVGYAVAPECWRGRGENVLALPAGFTTTQAEDLLRGHAARLLLTGTSVNQTMLEHAFILAARKLGIPSLSLLDFWTNYALRFSSQGGRLDRMTDRIAIMDIQAYDEMLAVGFPQERLVITGQPLFDSLGELVRGFSVPRRLALRRELEVAECEKLVLFAGQPLNDVYGAGGAKAVLGYDEWDALPPLVNALDRLRGEIPLCLVLLPHPREPREKYAPLLKGKDWARLAPAGLDSRSAVLAAELVAGMNSMLLMESVLLGTPAISFQPGLRGADALPVSRNGRIPRIEDSTDLPDALRTLLTDGEAHARQRTPLPEDAAEHVATLALELSRSGLASVDLPSCLWDGRAV